MQLPRIKSTTAHSSDTATEAATAAMQELSALNMYATKQERKHVPKHTNKRRSKQLEYTKAGVDHLVEKCYFGVHVHQKET